MCYHDVLAGESLQFRLTLQVRSFGQQLLESVAYLHDLELIHTDLKPENILLVSVEHSKQSSSRLITLPPIVL